MTWDFVLGLHHLEWQLQGVSASLAAVRRGLAPHAEPGGGSDFLQAYA